jgi:hypothetical protein
VPGGGGICESQLPEMTRGFTAAAEIEIAAGPPPAEGVICALGDLNGGWSFYLLNGTPVSCLISLGETTRIAAADSLPPGPHTVSVSYAPSLTPPARFCLHVDGRLVAEGDHGKPALFPGLSTAGARMLVGRDIGLPFNEDYQPPFPCTAILHRVVLRGEQTADPRTTAEGVDQAQHAD